MSRALALLVLTAGVARAQLPPITESFRASKLLRLEAVLGGYPWRHAAEITALGFSADGTLLATAGGDRRIQLWRVSGEELRTFAVVKGRTNQVGFAPDGATLYSTSSNGTIALWDVATGGQRLVLPHGGSVTAAAYSPDGKRLVSIGRDRLVKIWDPANGALIATTNFPPPADAGPGAGFVAVAATARTALVAFADGGVVEVDLASGTPGRAVTRALDIDAAAFSGDRRHLVAAAGGDLHVLDVARGTARVAARAVGPAVDVAVSADGRVTAWDLEHGERLLDGTGTGADLTSVALSPDGNVGASASRDYSFRLWDIGAGAARPQPSGRGLHAVEFIDAGHLVTGGADGQVLVWDLRARAATRLGQHDGAVYALARLGATTVISGGDDGTIRFWDLGGGKPVVVRGHPGGVLALAASADGKRLVSAGADERVRAWEPRRHRGLTELSMSAPVGALALAPDGKHGAAGDDSGLVRIFDLPGLGPAARAHLHTGLVLDASFAPDGKSLVTASEDDTLRLWSVRARPAGVLEGHRGPVTCAAFSADGSEVISGAKDGTLIVWDARTAKPVDKLDLGASSDVPTALALGPDGKRLAVATARGVVLLYAVTRAP